MVRTNLLLAVAIGVVLALAVIVWFYPSPSDFLDTNPSWNGTRGFLKALQARPVRGLADFKGDPSRTALLLIPYEPFSRGELASLRDFVAEGGTLVVLDDYGQGNQVLAFLGVEARFSGQPLLDPAFAYTNEWLPTIPVPGSDVSDAGALVLNHATALLRVPEPAILAQSSSFSFLDVDGNNMWDPPDEPRGPLPVAAHLPLGQGTLVLVADPSIVINSMNMAGNYSFIERIKGTRELLLDESHLPRPESVDLARTVLGSARRILATPLGGLALVLAILAPTLWPLWRNKGGKN